MKPALLVIDIQKQYVFADDYRKKAILQALPIINGAIDLFREKGLPIIGIQNINETQGVIPGMEGFNFIEELNILPEDYHICKTYRNAFNETELENILKKLETDTLVLTGYCAEFCVLSTYRGAEDRDFVPIILREGITSGSEANAKFVENINDIISLRALKQLLS